MNNLTKNASAWSTTEAPLTAEEEDTIVTVVVVVVGVLAAIIFIFSMGVFIDCRTQKPAKSGLAAMSKRKRMRLKLPPLGRAQKLQQQIQQRGREDAKYLATDMCPNGSSHPTLMMATTNVDAVV